jgi:hypothetical protein
MRKRVSIAQRASRASASAGGTSGAEPYGPSLTALVTVETSEEESAVG